MHDSCVELKEARGRTVKNMTVAYDEEYCAAEVEFEDGYSMNVDIIPARRQRRFAQGLRKWHSRATRRH